MVTLTEMSLACLLDCWTVMQMAQMKEEHSVQLTEMSWEILMVMLKVTSLVHLTAEQKEIWMVQKMAAAALMAMQKDSMMETN